jgi:hypothetical protein
MSAEFVMSPLTPTLSPKGERERAVPAATSSIHNTALRFKDDIA